MAKALGGNKKLSGELDKGKEMTLHMNELQVYQLLLFSFFYQGSADSRISKACLPSCWVLG